MAKFMSGEHTTMRYHDHMQHYISVAGFFVVVMIGLSGCADIDGATETDGARQAVIIELGTESAAFKNKIRHVLDDKAIASMRLYQNVQAIAVTLDGEMILKVLRLPDVISLRPDREIGPAIQGFIGGATNQSQPPKPN